MVRRGKKITLHWETVCSFKDIISSLFLFRKTDFTPFGCQDGLIQYLNDYKQGRNKIGGLVIPMGVLRNSYGQILKLYGSEFK